MRAADEQEEKRDARERVRPEPRRKGRWPDWPRLRRANPPFGTPLPKEMRSLGYPTKNNLRGTPLPEEMRSLGYPAKNILRGTIAILKQ